MRIWKALVATLCISASSYAGATSITYDVNQIDAATHTWQYDFSVSNNSLGAAINEFSIYFALGQYSNLQIVASPASWDSLVAQPDPLLPDDGFFDSLATGPVIAPGAMLGGFSVSFVFLGVGTPGSQPFDVFDGNFMVIGSGRTQPNGVTSVPEPGSLLLMGMAMLAAGALSARRSAHRGN